MPTIGSLCSGFGGLDLGLQRAGFTLAWHVEPDAACSTVLERHWPGVPNHGDLKTVDWSSVEPVYALCGGYPCQPFSHAGRRRGEDDPRHLWPFVAEAVAVLRPSLVLFENVAGHLSLGFDAVMEDLDDLGYDTQWTVVRASDVGAPHGRARVFILGHDRFQRRLRSGPDRRRGLCLDVPREAGHGGGACRGDNGEQGAPGTPMDAPDLRRQADTDSEGGLCEEGRVLVVADDWSPSRGVSGSGSSTSAAQGRTGGPGGVAPSRSGSDPSPPWQGAPVVRRDEGCGSAGQGEDWGAESAGSDPAGGGRPWSPDGCAAGGRVDLPAGHAGGTDGGAVHRPLAQARPDDKGGGVSAASRDESAAPHGRERVFILATPADAGRLEHERRRGLGEVAAGEGEGGEAQRERLRDTAGGRCAPTADLHGGGCEGGSEPDGRKVEPGLAASRRGDADRRRSAVADAGGERRDGREGEQRVRRDLAERGKAGGDARHSAPSPWGEYEPAIRRWEQAFGEHAPDPLDERGRLNVNLTRWMMGFPPGWHGDLPRTAALRGYGNAVQVQVAELVGRWATTIEAA